jgi:hypothetical protein
MTTLGARGWGLGARILAVAIAVMSPGIVRAQSLAGLAKQAEDASAANKTYTPSFNNANLAGPTTLYKGIMGHPITMAELRKWAAVVHDVAVACATDKGLRTRVLTAAAWATTIGEIERVYILEPAIGTIFLKHRMSAHDYAMTQISFIFALAAIRDRKFAAVTAAWGGQISANAELLRTNRDEAEAIAKDVSQIVEIEIG